VLLVLAIVASCTLAEDTAALLLSFTVWLKVRGELAIIESMQFFFLRDSSDFT
jgi:hypothetical protein